MTGPSGNAPAASFAPFSILRSGNGFTLAGELPDVDMKNSLLQSVTLALPGASVIDNLMVRPGVKPPDFAKLGGMFGASLDIPDFSLKLVGDTVTLTGTAPTEDIKAAAEAAAAETWPNVKIVNDIRVTAGRRQPRRPPGLRPHLPAARAPPCRRTSPALLRTPINFTTDGFTLAADSQQLVSQIAQKVKACPNAKLAVVGHTDNTGNDADQRSAERQQGEIGCRRSHFGWRCQRGDHLSRGRLRGAGGGQRHGGRAGAEPPRRDHGQLRRFEMDFIIQWVWYLLAFLVGSLVAWLLAAVSMKRTTEQEALADMPGSREPGDGS